MQKHSFTAVFVKSGGWYSGFVPILPGANAQGKTLREAKDNLSDAVRDLLEAYQQLSQREWMRGKDYVQELISC